MPQEFNMKFLSQQTIPQKKTLLVLTFRIPTFFPTFFKIGSTSNRVKDNDNYLTNFCLMNWV